MGMKKPLLLGHRGAKKYAQENTRDAFELCLAHRCDGFEFDVRLTGDEHAVCCHDPVWDDAVVADSALQTLGLMSMGDTFEYSDAFLDIEMKVPGIVPRFAQELRVLAPEQTLISSFLPEVVAEAQLFVPNIPHGLICRTPEQLAKLGHCDPDVLIAHKTITTPELIDATHAAGKRIFVWTVNDREEMLRLADLGADGILSDDTKLLAETLRPAALVATA